MDFSLQLYSARNHQPWAAVYQQIAALGYTQVEGFGGVYDDPKAQRLALDQAGLSMPSGHFSLDLLENDYAKAVQIATTLGVKRIYCPYLLPEQRPRDQAGWQHIAERLATVGEKVVADGFGFGWHNHDFEFIALADGTIPMEVLLTTATNMSWEADIAWVVRGGADPFAWIERYGSRISAVHLKDIAPDDECQDEDGWADLGHGIVPWRDLMPAIRAQVTSPLLILEHDNPKDLHRFVSRSFATANHL